MEDKQCEFCKETKSCKIYKGEDMQELELSGSQVELYGHEAIYICNDCWETYKKIEE